MLRNIYLKTLRDQRRALLWWVLGMFVFTFWMVTIFPSMQESGADLQSYVDNLPDSFKAMFGGDVLDIGTFEGFLTLELFSMFYPIMILAFTVSYGAGLLGGEEESGTLEILLSTPTPRWRVLLAKFSALITFTVIVLLATWLGIMAGVAYAGVEDVDAVNILFGVFNMAPLGLFFGAVAYFLTGVRGGRGAALGVTLALAAATYLVHTLSEVASIPEWLQRLSPWYYYDGVHALRDGVDPLNVAVLLGLAALLVGGAMWFFERRDAGV